MKNKPRAIDKRDIIRVDTRNDFITGKYILEDANGNQIKLSLHARKLLYLAISQVKQTDKGFYEFRVTPIEFADLMGVDVSNVYDTAKRTASQLRMLGLRCVGSDGRTTTDYNVFSYCQYSDTSDIVFKLNSDMTDLLIDLKKNFSQPLLADFIRMKSPYSMAVWHLMQREMKSKKPSVTGLVGTPSCIEFYLSLEELRRVTDTEDKLMQLTHFKERVLDKAIKEILDNCGVVIRYENVKSGRTVTGFNFYAYHFTNRMI